MVLGVLLLVIGSEREAKMKSGVLPELEMKPERKETIKKCEYVKVSDTYVLHTTRTE
jgi:hypothetical protein